MIGNHNLINAGARSASPLRVSKIIFAFLIFLLTACTPTPQQIELALLGDISLGRGINSIHNPDNTWDEALAYLQPILSEADLAFANLESPLTHNPNQIPDAYANPRDYNLCAPAESVQALQGSGLDVLGLVNNHALDCSADGLQQTREILQNTDLLSLPPGEVLELERKGIRLSLLAFDDINSRLDKDMLAQSIQSAGSTGNLVIVSIHWGAEYQPGPTPRQKELAQIMANSGAHLIIGHHPHVLQKIESIQGKDQPGQTLVLYSLGNALFDQPTPPDAARSVLLHVWLDKGGVSSYEAAPFHINAHAGVIEEANEDVVARVLRRLGVETSTQ